MAGSQQAGSIDQAAVAWVMAMHDTPGDAGVRAALAGWLASEASTSKGET